MTYRIVPLALIFLLGACTLVPEGRSDTAPVAARQASVSANPAARQCLAKLGGSGSQFAILPDRLHAGGCKMQNTVKLNDLRGDRARIGISNLGATACPTASAFADWARFGVDRAARQILGSGVAQIETMGSYVCRNVAGTNRLSAHGRAEAIDVAGFVLKDGRQISVLDDWDKGNAREREFLRLVQKSACKRFATVLGPEYNSAHRDHFHLESGTKGSFCR